MGDKDKPKEPPDKLSPEDAEKLKKQVIMKPPKKEGK